MLIRELLAEATAPKKAKLSPDVEAFMKETGAKVFDSMVIRTTQKMKNNLDIPPEELDKQDCYVLSVKNGQYFGIPSGTVGLIVKKGARLPKVIATINSDKPHIDPRYNSKISVSTTEKNGKTHAYSAVVFDVLRKHESVAAAVKDKSIKDFMIDKRLLSLKDAAPKADPVELEPEDGFFAICHWGNPYSDDDEYTWTGPFETRAAALAAGKRIIKRGPKRFVDWSGDSVKVVQTVDAFVKAAKKVGLNPKVTDLEFDAIM